MKKSTASSCGKWVTESLREEGRAQLAEKS